MPNFNDWYVEFKRNYNSSIRLFCFHHGGGSASTFREWQKDLIGIADLKAIQLPGRETRFSEPLLYNSYQVIEGLCSNFKQYTDKPFILLGQSIGALIAFEFIIALRKRGIVQPNHLIVSAAKSPQVPLKRKPLSYLPDLKFIEELKKYNGIPISLIDNEELLSLYLPAIRADFRIAESYQYTNKEPLNCPITALGGLSDNTFNGEDLLKWEQQTTCSFKYHFLPGDHFFIKTSCKLLPPHGGSISLLRTPFVFHLHEDGRCSLSTGISQWFFVVYIKKL
jgi:medium-chain acyl-[acyl-carrier-protein] hydrolase